MEVKNVGLVSYFIHSHNNIGRMHAVSCAGGK